MAQIFGFAPARLQEAALASKVMRARLLPAFKPTQPGALPGVNGTFRFIKSEFSGLFRQFTAAATDRLLQIWKVEDQLQIKIPNGAHRLQNSRPTRI
jgi:hypothetical protein